MSEVESREGRNQSNPKSTPETYPKSKVSFSVSCKQSDYELHMREGSHFKSCYFLEYQVEILSVGHYISVSFSEKMSTCSEQNNINEGVRIKVHTERLCTWFCSGLPLAKVSRKKTKQFSRIRDPPAPNQPLENRFNSRTKEGVFVVLLSFGKVFDKENLRIQEKPPKSILFKISALKIKNFPRKPSYRPKRKTDKP